MPEYRAILCYNRRYRIDMTFEAETDTAACAKRTEVEAWARTIIGRDEEAADCADAYVILDRLTNGMFDEEIDAFEFGDAG